MELNKFNAYCELQGHSIFCAHTYWRNKSGWEKDEFYDFVLVDTYKLSRVVVIRVSYDWDKTVDYSKIIAKYRLFFARVRKAKNGDTYYNGLGNKVYFDKDLTTTYSELTDFSKGLFEDLEDER